MQRNAWLLTQLGSATMRLMRECVDRGSKRQWHSFFGPHPGQRPDCLPSCGSETISGCGTSKDLMRPWDGRMILAQVGKWWFPFRRLVIRR